MKKVIVSVTNDLSTDQRVDKVCSTLSGMGFSVLLVGRQLPDSFPLQRNYATHRMRLLFKKGPLFYAEYNIRLFLFLFFHKAQLLVANDLDTLPANFLTHKLKRVPIVYDSHEYYTETPELVNRPFVQSVWKSFERYIFPRLTDVITVNDSIAALYKAAYRKEVNVIRNVPRKISYIPQLSPAESGLDPSKHLIILQGAGINIQRGAEEAIQAMQYVDNAQLLILGGGDVVNRLKEMAHNLNLSDRVVFMPRKPYNEMMAYTRLAEIGLTLDKDTNINYRFSLPNKLFDYIHAGTPVLASPLTEIKKIIQTYQVGCLTESHDPLHIASVINTMLSGNYKQKLSDNLMRAADELNWENEEKKLIEVYRKYA